MDAVLEELMETANEDRWTAPQPAAAEDEPPRRAQGAHGQGRIFYGCFVEVVGMIGTACPATSGGHQPLRRNSALTSGSPSWATRA